MVRGRLVTPGRVYADGLVVLAGDRVVAVGPAEEVAADLAAAHPGLPVPAEPQGTVLPGLFDLHCHGGGGFAFTAGDDEQVAGAARHHLGRGTTSVVAGVVTDEPERMLAAVAAAARAADRGLVAAVLVEGPFLASGHCGAQDPGLLLRPDPGLTRELLDAGRGHVRVMTLAPELPGAEDVVDLLVGRGVVAAVGHTAADADLVRRTLAAQPRGLVTHLFNGMPSLHHRDSGPVAGALSAAARDEARVELVADGVHLDDDTVRLVFDLLGPDRIALVTDAMPAAGMPDGDYALGPRTVRVAGGVARVHDEHDEGDDGDRDHEGAWARQALAGGTANLLDVVRRTVRETGTCLADAVTAASRTPARALGVDDEVGELRPGLRADLLVVDDALMPVRVMRAGAWLA